MNNKIPVPVIMYHSIGIPCTKWNFNFLTCPYEIFETNLKWLKKKNFNTITLSQLYNYMSKGIELPKNPIVLTFDDGYLDNWVFAYPLLKKYGFNAVIYVNPEFIIEKKVRYNLEDVWNQSCLLKDLNTIGYLSWEEIRIMEEENIIDIQSHTMSHTSYPISDKIVDFRHPRDIYGWMTWNDNTEMKPLLQIDNGNLISYGQPVYEHERSLGAKVYYPDPALDNFLSDFVNDNGGKKLFDKMNWKSQLQDATLCYIKKNSLESSFESDIKRKIRINYELESSKKIIERKLKKEVNFLCWPGGITNKEIIERSVDIGYISSTSGKDIQISKKKFIKNVYGDDPSRINRLGATIYFDGCLNFGKVKYSSGSNFIALLNRFQKTNKFSSYLTLGINILVNKIKYKLF